MAKRTALPGATLAPHFGFITMTAVLALVIIFRLYLFSSFSMVRQDPTGPPRRPWVQQIFYLKKGGGSDNWLRDASFRQAKLMP